jgi:two-component system sensor histidine kinase YesM
MSVMLLFQGISMGRFVIINSQQRWDYIETNTNTIASSLNSMGDNIHNIAIYISSFESFRNLYFPGRPSVINVADMVSDAFHTIRFIANYFPIIHDVAVVGLNKVPFSYYMGFGYEFMDLIGAAYDFDSPGAVESRFFYFEGKEYFVYVRPIHEVFSTFGTSKKIASCIFICDLNHIKELLSANITDKTVNFSILDNSGRAIVSSGPEILRTGKTREFVAKSGVMGLTVVAVGKPPEITAGKSAIRDESSRFIGSFFIFSFVLLVIITLMVIMLLQKKIALPVSRLVKSMVTQDDKPLHIRLSPMRINELDHIVEGVNKLLNEIEEYTKASLAAQEKLYEMELRKNEAEIYALQSQINPHFLNNTLQCIRSIAIINGNDEITRITLAMSELLRYSMNYQDKVRVIEEINIVKQYAMITNIRFQNRFRFSFQIAEEIVNVEMCRMILQPLAENAVRHGVSRREEGGKIEISGRNTEGIIIFEVSDNGPGFEGPVLEEIRKVLSYSFTENRETNRGRAYGLYNINRRIKLEYGESYGLEIEQKKERTLIRVRFPARHNILQKTQ